MSIRLATRRHDVLEASVSNPRNGLAYTEFQSTLVQRCYMLDVRSLSRCSGFLLHSLLLYYFLFRSPIISQALAPFFDVDSRCRYCWHEMRFRAAPRRRARRPSRFVCTIFLLLRTETCTECVPQMATRPLSILRSGLSPPSLSPSWHTTTNLSSGPNGASTA